MVAVTVSTHPHLDPETDMAKQTIRLGLTEEEAEAVFKALMARRHDKKIPIDEYQILRGVCIRLSARDRDPIAERAKRLVLNLPTDHPSWSGRANDVLRTVAGD